MRPICFNNASEAGGSTPLWVVCGRNGWKADISRSAGASTHALLDMVERTNYQLTAKRPQPAVTFRVPP